MHPVHDLRPPTRGQRRRLRFLIPSLRNSVIRISAREATQVESDFTLLPMMPILPDGVSESGEGEQPMAAQLTVLIPCKNEERNIGPCIDSVRELADEILVADSLSTDGTLDVPRRAGGCRIIQREFVDYANFKNWAIPHAANPWVLIVDADERVTPALAAEICQVLADPPGSVDAYWIPRRNFFLGHEVRHAGWSPDRICRLIRRDVCRYGPCRVHEKILVDKRRTRRLRGKLLHYVYWSLDQYIEKRMRYAKLSAEDWREQGRHAGFRGLLLRPMLRFVQTYFLRLGFLDGLPGLQVCMLTAFFNTFVRQARLWELEHALAQPGIEPESEPGPTIMHLDALSGGAHAVELRRAA
jgi:glycosyltransferase involved in cell wall biosynthesis